METLKHDIIGMVRRFLIPPGWKEVKCERCGRVCYIGEKQIEVIKKVGYHNCNIYCNYCTPLNPNRVTLADSILTQD